MSLILGLMAGLCTALTGLALTMLRMWLTERRLRVLAEAAARRKYSIAHLAARELAGDVIQGWIIQPPHK